jgi:hypothetical protein
MAAAVVTTLLVVIVLFGIWRIGVLGPALVFVVGAVVSFVLCVVGFGFVVLRLVLMVVLIGFRVCGSARIASLVAMAGAVVSTLVVAIVPVGIWRIVVLGLAVVLVVRAVVSFVDPTDVVGFGFVVLRLVG